MNPDRSFIPEGYTTVTPYLLNDGADRVIQFLQEVFGATVHSRQERDDGTLMHADLTIGDARLMIGNATDEWPATPGSYYVYVDDVDAAFERALQAGGRALREPEDQAFGDRLGGVADPGGNGWWIATPVAHLEAKRQRAAS